MADTVGGMTAVAYDFPEFLCAFPDVDGGLQINGAELASRVQQEFRIVIPEVLVAFWSQVGAGYFADGEIYFFGDASKDGRDCLITWNKMDFWSTIFPPPREGGPFFFAETCFGAQLGFRSDCGKAVGCLFEVDMLETLRVSDDLESMFKTTLADRHVFCDSGLLNSVKKLLGSSRGGMHYAPIMSPQVGGRPVPENYHFETPNVHLRTSIATWKATHGLP
jgi:hypothetical protein